MRLIPIIAAATIGLFATAATAQNMNTQDPNSAPKASSTGGKVKRPSSTEIKKMDTTDPNSAPKASATGGKPVGTTGQQNMDTANKGNPNTLSAGQSDAMAKKAVKKSKKKSKKSM
jgi:hypothetical protein